MIDAETRLYAVFGNPVRHSRGPFMHNMLMEAFKQNAVYLAFEIQDIDAAVQSIRTLSIKGISVTIPFKESILGHLDWIDPGALSIGAVNTVVNEDNTLKGYNTDWLAAVHPLKPYGLSGKTVCILGAGGAAKAVAYGAAAEKCRLFIAARNPSKGSSLAEKYQGEYVPMDCVDQVAPDIIVNTTPVGMHPDTGISPVPAHVLKPGMVVMDIVYTPLKTRFLEHARQNGCHVIDGLDMFIAQGAAQFKLWTGILPDINLVRQHFLEKGF